MLILDMHQDLYSRKFDNGAPLWATLDDGAEHVTGTIWSDAYLMSPAVQRAFDNFWQNRPLRTVWDCRTIMPTSGKCWQADMPIRYR